MEVFYDNLDDVEAVDFSPLDKAVANQCIAIYDVVTNVYIGSGILITNQGLFVSAAHNFNNVGHACGAFFNGEPYEIKTLFIEYDQDLIKDLFIGELVNYKQYDFPIVSLADSERIAEEKELKVCGYKSKDILAYPINKDIKISDKLYVNQYCPSVHIVAPEIRQKIDGRILKGVDIDVKKYEGLSGGPIYGAFGVYGILKGNLCLTAEYIKSHIPR